MSQGGRVTADFAVSLEMATGGGSGIGSGSARPPVTKLVTIPLFDSAEETAPYGVGAIAGQVERESSKELQLPALQFQQASNLKLHVDAIKDPSNTSPMQMKRSSPNTTNMLYPESACRCNPMVGQTVPNIFAASTRGSLMNFMDDGHPDVKETMNHGLEELKMVLQKELTNSDVGRFGRIVLPKKEAESNLPPLSERDGMMLQMDDLILPTTWKFKYRFWPNNRSRMYIMETTGDFVRTHGLQAGDFFIIYKNSASGNYVVASEKRTRLPTSVDLLHCHSMNQCNMNEDGNSLLSRIGKVRGAKHQLCLEPSKSLGQGRHSFLTVARNDSLRTDVLKDFDGDPAGPHFQSLPP